MVTIDNYEYFFYQYAEGLLTEAERADVEAFARQHPDLAEELSLYDPAVKAEAPPVWQDCCWWVYGSSEVMRRNNLLSPRCRRP